VAADYFPGREVGLADARDAIRDAITFASFFRISDDDNHDH
jgi:hypothetical protein